MVQANSCVLMSMEIVFILLLPLLAPLILSERSSGLCVKESTYVTETSIKMLHVQDGDSKQSQSVSNQLKSWVRSSRYNQLTGSTHAEIAAKVNKFMAGHQSVRSVIPCSDLDVEGVALLAEKLKSFIDTSMWQSFPQDDGRQVELLPWNTRPVGLHSRFHRDALCAETVKLWSHHITKSMKEKSLDVILPSLPIADWDTLELNYTVLGSTARMLNKSVSCVAGHTVFDADYGEEDIHSYDWPYWPMVSHWRAKGHGPYPFWQFGPPLSAWTLNESFSTPFLYNPGNDMEVWHSSPLRATKFYHSSCRWEWLGFPMFDTDPCIGLMLNKFGAYGQWYLYTADKETKGADERFCCESTWENQNGMHLGTINRKFIDNLIYVGEANFTGDYYEGRSKRYVMSMDFAGLECPECGDEPTLPINIFYETDLEGKPLRFGEWGQHLDVNGFLHDSDLPLMYEEMDPSSWDDLSLQNFGKDVFKVPKACLTTYHSCKPGRTNREVPDNVTFALGAKEFAFDQHLHDFQKAH